MSNATRTRGIFAPVIALAFNASQLEDLQAFLARRSENTEAIPISDVEQLLLAGDGRLAETGYRFNYLGFQSLCSGTAMGLNALFNELSGEGTHRTQTPLTQDLPAAISVYNTTVRSKIEYLRERTLLVDNRERTVEGFMGLAHRMLDNSQFLEIVTSEMRERRPQAQFYRAELLGRELRLFYIDPESLRKDIYSDSRHSLLGGWVFTNQEDRGKSIHAVRCILTKFGVAMEKAQTTARLTHVGADIVGRTQLLVSKAAGRDLDMPAVLSQIASLQMKLLGFVDNPEKLERASVPWTEQLVRMGLRRDDAKLIVRNTALVGADLDPRDAVEVYTRSVLGSRTAYDLLCALLRFSRTEPPKIRDKIQEVAMQFLAPSPRRRRTR